MFDRSHNLLVIYGTSTTGGFADIWQCTLRFSGDSPGDGTLGTAAQVQGMCDEVWPKVNTWWNNIRTMFPSSIALAGVKFNPIGTDGKYRLPTTAVHDSGTVGGLPGTGSANGLPAQVALAVTFTTAAARGLASKGRLYLPALDAVQSVGGYLNATSRGTIQSYTASMVTSLNTWTGTNGGTAHVLSRVGAGAGRPITGVSVGRRFDTQRRRVNKVQESRSAAATV